VKHQDRFPDWNSIYAEQSVETMPWYNPELDFDLKSSLGEYGIEGGRFLDIGTGPGTQAIELAKIGFSVTGTDLSKAAIEKAKDLARKERVEVTFIQDDILRTNLRGEFDYAFDRGCFHVFSPDSRPQYVRNIAKLIRSGGILFLKTFSSLQPPSDQGPYRFKPKEIETLFQAFFSMEEFAETVYQGPLTENPKALLTVLRRK
jgi:2-polyprenyl-3-methyl-5-hydroxy-6-metoxy-1,4-benzoquinol methylase